jgi:hypothetical protein
MRAGDNGEIDKALVAVIAILIVLLLLATNIQLWRLSGQSNGGDNTAATVRSALPAPVTGTSNDVLSKQMHRLSTKLTVPLNGLRSQLTGLQGLGREQRGVAKQIKRMNASIQGLGGVPGEIARMSGGLGKMVVNTSDMSSGLVTMGRDMNATRMSMGGMVKVMKRVEAGIEATNASSAEASSGIAAMRDATIAMSESFAATAANSKETTASLAAMNQHMADLVELFCLAFNSGLPACAAGEGASAAALAPAHSESQASVSGGLLRQGLVPALPLEPGNGGRTP